MPSGSTTTSKDHAGTRKPRLDGGCEAGLQAVWHGAGYLRRFPSDGAPPDTVRTPPFGALLVLARAGPAAAAAATLASASSLAACVSSSSSVGDPQLGCRNTCSGIGGLTGLSVMASPSPVVRRAWRRGRRRGGCRVGSG